MASVLLKRFFKLTICMSDLLSSYVLKDFAWSQAFIHILDESKAMLTQNIWAAEQCNRIHEWKSWPGLLFVTLPRDNSMEKEQLLLLFDQCKLLTTLECQGREKSEPLSGQGRSSWRKKTVLKPSGRRGLVQSSCWNCSEFHWQNIQGSEVFWIWVISVLAYHIYEDDIDVQWEYHLGFL